MLTSNISGAFTKLIIDDFNNYFFDDACEVYKDFITKDKTPYYAGSLKVFYANIQRLKSGNPAPTFILKNEYGNWSR